MARGKFLSLEEARQSGKISSFCKEHPSQGDEVIFDRLFGAMAKGKPPRSSGEDERTSPRGNDACCIDIRTRPGTSKDAGD